MFVQNDLTRMTFDVLGKCLLGYEFNSIEAGDTPLSQTIDDITGGPDVSGLDRMLRKLTQWLPFRKAGTNKFVETFKSTSKVIKQVRSL